MCKRHLKQGHKVSLSNLHQHAPATVKKIRWFLSDFLPPTLKYLSLSGHSSLLDYISESPRIFQNMEKQVWISGFTICAESLKQLFESCRHVEELVIKGCTYSVTDTELVLDPTLTYRIKTLNLYWTYRMAGAQLHKLDLSLIFNPLALTNLRDSLETVVVSKDNWMERELTFIKDTLEFKAQILRVYNLL